MPQPEYCYRCLVTQVIDGDTVIADVDLGFGVWLHNRRLRLLGIDTPEAGQPGAAEAAGRVRDLVCHKLCVARTTRDRGDKYGRYLVELFAGGAADGTSVNDVLLREGLAKPYDGRRE